MGGGRIKRGRGAKRGKGGDRFFETQKSQKDTKVKRGCSFVLQILPDLDFYPVLWAGSPILYQTCFLIKRCQNKPLH